MAVNLTNYSYVRLSHVPGKPESYSSFWYENPSPAAIEVLKKHNWIYSQNPHFPCYRTSSKEDAANALNELGYPVPNENNLLDYYVELSTGTVKAKEEVPHLEWSKKKS